MKKIILIEDESSVVSFIKKGLQELGYEITVALDGATGIKLVDDIFCSRIANCSGDSLSFGCRNLWTILLRKNISGNRSFGSLDVIRHRLAKRFNGKYLKLLCKNNAPYRNHYRFGNFGIDVYSEKIQKKP